MTHPDLPIFFSNVYRNLFIGLFQQQDRFSLWINPGTVNTSLNKTRVAPSFVEQSNLCLIAWVLIYRWHLCLPWIKMCYPHIKPAVRPRIRHRHPPFCSTRTREPKIVWITLQPMTNLFSDLTLPTRLYRPQDRGVTPGGLQGPEV